MKNKIIELIEEIEDAEDDVFLDKFYQFKNKIQALEFPVTLEEVQEYCKNCTGCKLFSPDNGGICYFEDKGLWDWDIDLITKAIRGSK
jgi:hypothetical protein